MINQVACASAFSNVGVGRCSFIPREIVGAMLVSANFVITEADSADLQTFLQDAAADAVAANRLLPIHGFVGITDSSEDVTRETLGYGVSRTLRDGNYGWTLRFVEGGLCLLTALQEFNGQRVYVIFIDAAGNLIGTKKPTGLGGIPVDDFWANKWVPSDGTTTANLSLFFSFRPEYINQRLAFIQTSNIPDFDFDSIVGLQDVAIQILTAAAGTVTLKLADRCSMDNSFSDLFGADLVAADGITAVGVDGSVQTIDAQTFNATTRVYTLTFDPTRTVASIINLIPVADLETAGISGYEGRSVVAPVTLP